MPTGRRPVNARKEPKIRPLLTLTALTLAFAASTAEARPKPVPLLKGTIIESSAGSYRLGKWSPGVGNAINAIYWAWCGKRYVRCAAGDEAMVVADCETGSTFSVWASNGTYQGLFQVSGGWRSAIPGFAYNPWAQARHAHRIYVQTGGWSHWQCSPYGGLNW